MSTQGIFNSSNFSPEQTSLQSFQGAMFRKFPGGMFPLTGFTSQIKQGSLMVPLHTWETKTQEFPHSAVTAQVASAVRGAVTAIAVQNALIFSEGGLVQASTGEQMRVQSITGQFEILVARGFGVVPPQVIPAGTELWQMGTAFEEASLRPQAKSSGNGRKMTNVPQIFRDSWAVSGTAAAAELAKYQESPLATNLAEATFQHAIGQEMALIFGQRYETTYKRQPLRTMDGIISLVKAYAPDNVHVAPKYVTLDMLEDMLDPVFEHNTDIANPNDRLLFVGRAGRKLINKLGKYSGQNNIKSGETKFGHQFTEFITTRGNYKMMEHPLLNLNPEWSRMILCLDLSSLRLLNMNGRKTTHTVFNPQINRGSDTQSVDAGIDATGGSFLTEQTLEVSVPEAHAIIYGICEAAVTPQTALPTTYCAQLEISAPCVAGPVAGGTVVTLTVSGTKLNHAFTLVTPTGLVTMTTDGNGTATTTYTLPAYQQVTTPGAEVWGNVNPVYFSITTTATDTQLSSGIAVACVKAPCDDVTSQTEDPLCVSTGVTTDNNSAT